MSSLLKECFLTYQKKRFYRSDHVLLDGMKAACVKPPHGWKHRTVACTGYTAKPKIPATFLRVRTTVLFKLVYKYKIFIYLHLLTTYTNHVHWCLWLGPCGRKPGNSGKPICPTCWPHDHHTICVLWIPIEVLARFFSIRILLIWKKNST